MEEHSFDLLNGKNHDEKNRLFDHLKKDNDIFNNLLQGYILNCHCEGKSPKTVSFYQGNLKRFIWYCRENDYPEDPGQLTPTHIRQFLWYVSSEPMRWGINSSRSIRPAKKAAAHYYHCRTILMMFIDSGMRVSELAGLRLPDVDMNSGSILISNGKGGKQRTVRIGAKVQKALWRYLTLFRKGASDRLFLTNSSQPLEADAIKQIVRRLGQKAGVPGVHVHRLRHTFAISFLRAGGDIFSLKYLLGHNSLTMVENYLGSLNAEDAVKAHQKFSPVDNMRS